MQYAKLYSVVGHATSITGMREIKASVRKHGKWEIRTWQNGHTCMGNTILEDMQIFLMQNLLYVLDIKWKMMLIVSHQPLERMFVINTT